MLAATSVPARAKNPPARRANQPSACHPERPGQHALLRVQTVLGFVEHHRSRAVDDVRGDFLAAVRRQAMHEDRVFRRLAPSAPRSPDTAPACCAGSSSDRPTSTPRCPSPRNARPSPPPPDRPSARSCRPARAPTRSGPRGGRSASGVARRRVKPNRTAASIQLRATLLPSPHQATT